MKWGGIYTCSLFTILPFVCSSSILTSVAPPSDFQFVDPGYLGWMVMQWQSPKDVHNLSNCEVKYKLQYHKDDEQRWKTVLTRNFQYSDGFNLNKELIARIRTMAQGPCTNGSAVWSRWTEAYFKPTFQGAQESEIQHFHCTFYNWEHLICTWISVSNPPSGTNYYLSYWYEGLPEAVTCKDYFKSHDINVGCSFENQKLTANANMFVCLTGYHGSKSHKPSYFNIELQNIVKPSPPERVILTSSRQDGEDSDDALIAWSPPKGKVPPHCLEYETHVTDDNFSWKALPVERETTYTTYKLNHNLSLCARVRGKVHMFCADDGFWSEWSPSRCLQVTESNTDTVLFIALGIVLLLLCIISIVCWIAKKGFNINEKFKYPLAL
ncbi:interleukin-13 receptor subunit alpha-2 isoform X2 [Lissotriton helveticus]